MINCATHNQVLKYLFWGTLFLLLAIRMTLFGIEFAFSDSVDLVTNFPSSSQVYDRNGVLLYEYFDKVRRIPVDKEEIPYYLVQATLMAEDERFFNHAGFDPLGIVRAFWRNLKAWNIEEGGSTLGQQLVKNTILGPSEGYWDKIEEILFSVAVDARLSKHDILYLYLNTIPYGSNAYGVEAASRYYFDKHVADISIAESAILASLPKQPTYLSPHGDHLDELIQRRDYILEKMLEKNYITEGQHQSAIEEEIVFNDPEMEIKAPHFVMHVKEQLIDLFGEEQILEGGLLITTTLDYDWQVKAEEVVASNEDIFDWYKANSTGLVALNPKNGEVLVMVGNRDYFDLENAGNFNMTLAKRQPGSAFKPIVYAALLEQAGFSPAGILYDVAKNFAEPKMDPYIPRNYDNRYRGAVTVRSALAQSLNVPAVQALMEVGIDETLNFAETMGFSTLDDRTRFGPSLVLGGAEVTLLDLTSAYSAFSNRGVHIAPKSIKKVDYIEGGGIRLSTPPARQVVYPETAYQVTSMLSDNVARSPVFGYRSVLAFNDKVVAAKTGTTQEYRDAWTIGYSSNVAVGVWVGNHDNIPLRPGSAGVFAAGPIWRDFIDGFLEEYESQEFAVPEKLEKKTIYTIAGKRYEYVAPWQLDSIKRFYSPPAPKMLAVTEVYPNKAVNSTEFSLEIE